MKKLAKVLGPLVVAAVLLWVMRDRFVSIAAPHDPELPVFRTQAGDPVEAVNGIGPVFSRRLAQAGIEDIRALASASLDTVAEAAGVSVARARSWITKAQLHA